MPTITLKGNPISLAGPELKVGDPAPNFKLQGSDMSEITLDFAQGKPLIIASIPSLDTPVCHKETKQFNDEVAKHPGVQVLCVSTDLPFGQKRWCGAENVANVKCASDHRDASFGSAYGVLIKGGPLDRCLARAIFVVGPDKKLKHVEYVKEIAEEPNYAAALAAAKG